MSTVKQAVTILQEHDGTVGLAKLAVGACTLRQIAQALNARGIPTARGGQWYAQSVANVLARA
jgi:Recombinase